MSGKRTDPVPAPAGVILIADDNQDDIALVTRDLRRMGLPHAIHSVPNGEQVIAYLKGVAPYDDRDRFPQPVLLVLDLKMEPMDGFAVLKWLQENPRYKTFPVLVLTGLLERNQLSKAYQLGATTFLTKPAALNDLKETFHALNILPKKLA